MPSMNPPPHGDARLEEAAHWLARLDSGTASPEEFEAWRAADPRHAAAFVRIAGVWSQLGQVKNRSHGQLAAEPDDASQGLQSTSRRAFLRAASVAGAALLAGGSLYAGRTLSRERARTGLGERRVLRLADDCQLELNTDSEVAWRFSRDSRRFWLERGEVSLLIPADASRPCTLDATSTVATLDGGEFNARLRGKSLELLVVRGAGSISRTAQKALRLESGQSAFVTGNAMTRRAVTRDTVESVIAWRRGEILFRGESLAAAVADYNRYLTRKLVITDPSVAAVKLGGRFTTTDPTTFLASLHDGFGIVAEPRDDGTLALVRHK